MKYEKAKIGDVCEFIRGLTYSKSDEVDLSKNIVLRATNIDLSTYKLDLTELRYISDSVTVRKDKKIRKDDILICTASGSKSHLGKVAYVEEELDMAFGGFMGVLRANENKVLSKYLFKNLISNDFINHILSLSDGANINNLKFSQIENFEIILPPVDIQKSIVNRLDKVLVELDLALEATQAKVLEISSLKQSLLKRALSGEIFKE